MGCLDFPGCELTLFDPIAYSLLTDTEMNRSLFDGKAFHLVSTWYHLPIGLLTRHG